MPVLWQSSQRPMYVRTVFVGRFRHAILSYDDPYYLNNAKRRRPKSSATCTSKSTRNSSRFNSHDDFDFVVRNNYYSRAKSVLESDIGKLDFKDLDQESEGSFMVKATAQPLLGFDENNSKFESFYFNMKHVKNTGRSEEGENTGLSERVLQWLDLAGKIDLLAPNNNERINKPRHSWPEIQRKNYNLAKSKTAVDVKAKDKTPSAKLENRGIQSAIDRHDSYVPTSANTIENYARQSRKVLTQRGKTNECTHKKKNTQMNVLETRQKMIRERSAVEKQYAELVTKKLLPDTWKQGDRCNKKQVHIFMPDLPKKVASISTSRTESMLSQFSQIYRKSNA